MAEEKKINAVDKEESEEKAFNRKEKCAREVYEWVQTFCQALFAVVLIFTFLCRFVTVDGSSMNNTLTHGDRLIISNLFYTPERGDIVVVHDLETEIMGYNPYTGTYELEQAFRGPIIKRVIATEGEKVVIDYDKWEITVTDKDGNVTVLNEPYVNFEDYPMHVPNKSIYPSSVGHLEEHIVADGCVFVCGDNRNYSLDSRYVGDIEAEKVLGKVLVRVIPKPSVFPKPEY